MIISPITGKWAQWSYDKIAEKGFGESGHAPLAHLGVQIGNAVAHLALPIQLTRMSNPHLMSYAYRGLDPLKFGMKAAMASRKAFQMESSMAYRMGAKLGEHLAYSSSKQGKAALKAMQKGAHIGGRVGFRAIPGLGWAMLSYDAYDLLANKRLFGVKL